MKKIIVSFLLIGLFVTGCASETNEVKEEQKITEESNNSEKVEKETEENNDDPYVYEDGRARLEPPTATDAVAGFVEYIRKNGLYDEEDPEYGTEVVYQLIYLDSDDVPELIYGSTEGLHASNIYILKYKTFGVTADDIIKVGPFGSYNMTSYYPYCNLIFTVEPGHMGVTGGYYSTINEMGECESVGYSEDYYEDENYESVSESHYYLGNDHREVSEEEYNNYISQLTGDVELVQFDTYDNEEGYHILNEEALKNNLYAEEFFSLKK